MRRQSDCRNWGAKSGFFYAGSTLIVTIWAYFRVPETGGFSFAELDILFTNKVSARKFTKVRVRDEAAGDQTFDGAEPAYPDDVEKVGADTKHIEVLDEKKA